MLTFPTHLFNPARTVMRPTGVSISGGESISGITDTIRTDGGGYWVIHFAGVELTSPDLVRAWRAWEDTLEQGVTKVLVPVADVRMAPRPVVGGRLSSPSQLHPGSDDPYFPEAVGFATPWIVATCAAALLRATQINLNMVHGARVKGGEVFAISHAGGAGRRIYRIRRVLSRVDQAAVVEIRPPLREAIADNTPLDFDWPSVVATLMPDADISPDLLYGSTGTVDISFREAF